MKSIVKESPKAAKEMQFPVLLREKVCKVIVLFKDNTTGVVIDVGNSAHSLGDVASNWTFKSCPKEWEKFNGEITLSNEC